MQHNQVLFFISVYTETHTPPYYYTTIIGETLFRKQALGFGMRVYPRCAYTRRALTKHPFWKRRGDWAGNGCMCSMHVCMQVQCMMCAVSVWPRHGMVWRVMGRCVVARAYAQTDAMHAMTTPCHVLSLYLLYGSMCIYG